MYWLSVFRSTRWFFLRGFVLSLVSGLLYGFSFIPVQFMKLCEDEEHSCSGKSVVSSLVLCSFLGKGCFHGYTTMIYLCVCVCVCMHTRACVRVCVCMRSIQDPKTGKSFSQLKNDALTHVLCVALFPEPCLVFWLLWQWCSQIEGDNSYPGTVKQCQRGVAVNVASW